MTHRRLFRIIAVAGAVACLIVWGISLRHGAGVLLVAPAGTAQAAVYQGTLGLSVAIPEDRPLPRYDLLTEVVPIRNGDGRGWGDWWVSAFDDGIALYQLFSDGDQPAFFTSGTHVVLGLPLWSMWLLLTGAAFTGCRWMGRRSGSGDESVDFAA